MKRSIVFVSGLVLALGACSDTSGPEGDRLTRTEAIVLTSQVLAMSEGAVTGSVSASAPGMVASGTAAAPSTITHTHESSHPCPSGGQLDIVYTLTGSVDEEANSLQADLAGTHTHASCAFPGEDDLTFTVDGEIDFGASIGIVDAQPSQPFTFSLAGGFDWSASDGRSGSCPLTLETVTDFAAQEHTVTGSICGHTVSETTTWTN